MNPHPIPAVTVTAGHPIIVAQSAAGERRWGHYQFPQIDRVDDSRLSVDFSVHADSAICSGAERPVCVSDDAGQTWHDATPGEANASNAGAIVFADGEAIMIPRQKPIDASQLKLPANSIAHTDHYGRKSDCYRLGDLPVEASRVKLLRRLPGQSTWHEEWATLDVAEMVVHVWRREWSDTGWSDPNILQSPHIRTEFFWIHLPDGGLLNFTYMTRFNTAGTQPDRGSVVVLRSDDRGRTWRQWGLPGVMPDREALLTAVQPFLDDPQSNYNRLWRRDGKAPVPNLDVGGFFEPGVTHLGDGRMICVMRTDSGGTHEPMFLTRSEDWGRTWTAPEILTPFGVMPRLVRLDNGIIALVYGRPGVQLLFCTDGIGATWHSPMNLLPEPSEKTPASIGRRGMTTADTQVGHDDTCGNCTVLKTGHDRFLVAYSNFRHMTAEHRTAKAICVREIRVGIGQTP